jgi:hypothetical protein
MVAEEDGCVRVTPDGAVLPCFPVLQHALRRTVCREDERE